MYRDRSLLGSLARHERAAVTFYAILTARQTGTGCGCDCGSRIRSLSVRSRLSPGTDVRTTRVLSTENLCATCLFRALSERGGQDRCRRVLIKEWRHHAVGSRVHSGQNLRRSVLKHGRPVSWTADRSRCVGRGGGWTAAGCGRPTQGQILSGPAKVSRLEYFVLARAAFVRRCRRAHEGSHRESVAFM